MQNCGLTVVMRIAMIDAYIKAELLYRTMSSHNLQMQKRRKISENRRLQGRKPHVTNRRAMQQESI